MSGVGGYQSILVFSRVIRQFKDNGTLGKERALNECSCRWFFNLGIGQYLVNIGLPLKND